MEMTVGKHGEAEHKREEKETRTTKKGSGRGNNGDEMRETENRTRARTVSRLYVNHHGMNHLPTWATSRYIKELRKKRG